MLEILMTLAPVLLKMVVILGVLIVCVAYLTMAERKVIGYIQGRIGPNRVGFRGILQPIADAIKLIFKEIIIPAESNKILFLLAPLLTLGPSLAAWAVIPFGEGVYVANINAGVLYVFAMSSMTIYGILIAGWATNSKYAMYGALRSAAQTISYEIPMGFALVGVLMAAGTMNLHDIVLAQAGGLSHWFIWPLFPLFGVYWISGVAETNRPPFDMAEGESEIVAGFHVEYSGITFTMFFFAEYANMILIATLVSLFFLGGWLSPFEGIPFINQFLTWIPGIIWMALKAALFLYVFLWIRATFPRYRYDQIMRLGWKVLIPVTLVWIFVTAIMIKLHVGPWFT